METDWTKSWEINYGTAMYRIYVRVIERTYLRLLENIDLRNPSILELGAGSGVHSLHMAKRLLAREVTLVDNNPKALEIAKKLFSTSDLDAKVSFLNTDIRTLELDQKFDIVHSEGVLEHFYGSKRVGVFEKHHQFCEATGIVIMLAPLNCLRYQVTRWLKEKTHTWYWDEQPLSRRELHDLGKNFGMAVVKEYMPILSHEIGILFRHTGYQS